MTAWCEKALRSRAQRTVVTGHQVSIIVVSNSGSIRSEAASVVHWTFCGSFGSIDELARGFLVIGSLGHVEMVIVPSELSIILVFVNYLILIFYIFSLKNVVSDLFRVQKQTEVAGSQKTVLAENYVLSYS